MQRLLVGAAAAWPLVLPTLFFASFVSVAHLLLSVGLPLLLAAPAEVVRGVAAWARSSWRGQGHSMTETARGKLRSWMPRPTAPTVVGCVVTAVSLRLLAPAVLEWSVGGEQRMLSGLVRGESVPPTAASRAVAHACRLVFNTTRHGPHVDA